MRNVYYQGKGVCAVVRQQDEFLVIKSENMVIFAKKGTFREELSASEKAVARSRLSERPSVEFKTWNRRYRDNQEKLQSLNFNEVIDVYVELMSLKESKDLSFGERKMIDYVKQLIESELGSIDSHTSEK